MNILGISAYYHDAAAAIVCDGVIVAAAQEERFSRLKNDPGFPRQAIIYCLAQAGLQPADLDAVVFYEKPFLKFDRIIETYLATAPRGFASFRRSFPLWIREKVRQKAVLCEALGNIAESPEFWRKKIRFSEHHLSHAASAYYPSPFDSAAVLTVDGVGEWASASIGVGRGTDLRLLTELHFPHSLGLLYSAFTEYLGFSVNSGEYKVMGLAPYGEPVYQQLIFRELINLQEDGSFRLNPACFDFLTGERMTNRRFHGLFGAPPRRADDVLTDQHRNIAASIQAVLEECMFRLARQARDISGESRLCLAGGVALNCSANGKLRRSGEFDEIWVQPAAGDAGGALGAALAFHYASSGQPDHLASRMHSALLGPEYEDAFIGAELDRLGARYQKMAPPELIDNLVERLLRGQIIGWFQGRMEYGPRALGARSIIANPMIADMRETVNARIKKRENFRPFAPAVLEDQAGAWFDGNQQSPFMLFTVQARSEVAARIPAVVHVDGSSRIQTVSAQQNPVFHQLLTAFHQASGCPMLLNTSFNVKDEPIVMSPEDALRCMHSAGLDALAIGNYLVTAAGQTVSAALA